MQSDVFLRYLLSHLDYFHVKQNLGQVRLLGSLALGKLTFRLFYIKQNPSQV